MIDQFPFYLCLIVAIVFLVMLANHIKVAYPIILVVAGLIVSFIPGLPSVRIEPEMIFLFVLPPLLFDAAWSISWRELWKWRRIVGSFAFVVVFISAFSVALVANHFIPGFTLALGFLLGGIVSPPDAVSAGAIVKFMKVPRRMSSIIEGESLLNDASSLIIFRFALIAIGTGQFVWYDASMTFLWMVAGGVGIGLIIAWVFMKVQKHLPTDSNMDIVLTIVAPYIMYIVAEDLRSSGILAVVSGGLLLSNRRYLFLSTSSRIRGVNVWESLVFVLNGLVFILIGLELPEIVGGLGDLPLSSAIGYGLLITGALFVSRMLSAYGAVIITLIMRNFITVADTRHPGYKTPFILGWTGMRGVVSLAAALAIPVYTSDGVSFPQRNLILFITFIVILTTLIVQGLTLPYFIRKLDTPYMHDTMPDEEAHEFIRKDLNEHTLEYLLTNHQDKLNDLPLLTKTINLLKNNNESIFPDSKEYKSIHMEALQSQRTRLLQMNHERDDIDDAVLRQHLTRIDIEEERLRYT
ncbi:MAG: Na+/H+ antiporter [Bacteroidota bacterium]